MFLTHSSPEAAVDVVVCTYKRAMLLARLIERLASQRLDGLRLRLLVVDNDPAASAHPVVQQARQRHPFLELCLLHEPVQNIARARNAGLAACHGDFVAFVDDDELPCFDWLWHFHRATAQYGADLVFGPVLSDYAAATPEWVVQGGFFERPRHATGVAVPLLEARTGNVLINARLLDEGLRFNESLGLSGGEDYEFFSRLFPKARRVIWCDEAEVSETVPPERARVGWLLRRSFRIGSVEAALSRKSGSAADPARIVLKATALLLATLARLALIPLAPTASRVRILRTGALAAGRLYGLVHGPYQEYR